MGAPREIASRNTELSQTWHYPSGKLVSFVTFRDYRYLAGVGSEETCVMRLFRTVLCYRLSCERITHNYTYALCRVVGTIEQSVNILSDQHFRIVGTCYFRTGKSHGAAQVHFPRVEESLHHFSYQ